MKSKIFVFMLFFLCVTLGFSGCIFIGGYVGNTSQKPDVNINMTPRLISAQSAINFEEVVETVSPAVVGISAVYGDYESVGSGVAVADGGYVLTNNHVVNGASSITVYYANKTSGRASLVWSDSAMDLAIIKTAVNIPYLEMAGGQNLLPGQEVISIGTPLTLQFKHSVTKGIVSATNRTLEIDNEDGTTSYLQNLIQHDCSINPGNSGGPVINGAGQVVAINTLKVSEAEGLGFAIPAEVAVPVINHILEDGTYQTPYLGMFGLDSEIALFYGRTLNKDGVYVISLDETGPVANAGLQKGDIITKVGSYEIKTMLNLRTAIYNYKIGDLVELSFLRDGILKTTTLNLTSRP